MDAISISLPATQPWGLKRGVLVDARGQRFINEDAYYGQLGEQALLHHGGRAWLVVDDAVFEEPTYPREVVAVGETPGELERELALPEGSLEATLALYNRHAEAGADPVFHKTAAYLTPLVKPPFGAFDCHDRELDLRGLHPRRPAQRPERARARHRRRGHPRALRGRPGDLGDLGRQLQQRPLPG